VLRVRWNFFGKIPRRVRRDGTDEDRFHSANRADTLVSADSSCLMQMAGAMSKAGVPIRTMHLAEVLASR